jgi:hypothetical protein
MGERQELTLTLLNLDELGSGAAADGAPVDTSLSSISKASSSTIETLVHMAFRSFHAGDIERVQRRPA